MASLQSLEIEQARLRERHEENPSGRLFAPLADVLRKMGRLDEALEMCAEGLSRHAGYSSAYVILGKIQLERGDSAAALEAFEKVLELDGENLLALRHLAQMREAAGQLDAARVLWEKVAALEPESEAVEERLSALRRRMEQRAAVLESPSPEADVLPEEATEEPAEETAEEPTEDAAEEPTEELEEPNAEPAHASAPAPSAEASSRASSAEIATITLAQIYYEQGFLRKALEVYEQVQERNPQLEGITSRVEDLRAEIERGRMTPQPTEAALDELVVAERPAGAAGGTALEDEPGPLREGPITRTVRDRSEQERFDGFRRWLDGIADDDQAGSE